MCKPCPHGNPPICNPIEAEIRCMVCGRCEAEELLRLSTEAATSEPLHACRNHWVGEPGREICSICGEGRPL